MRFGLITALLLALACASFAAMTCTCTDSPRLDAPYFIDCAGAPANSSCYLYTYDLASGTGIDFVPEGAFLNHTTYNANPAGNIAFRLALPSSRYFYGKEYEWIAYCANDTDSETANATFTSQAPMPPDYLNTYLVWGQENAGSLVLVSILGFSALAVGGLALAFFLLLVRG